MKRICVVAFLLMAGVFSFCANVTLAGVAWKCAYCGIGTATNGSYPNFNTTCYQSPDRVHHWVRK